MSDTAASIGEQPAPRLKRVNRQQFVLRTVDVENLIPSEHPARAIWEFVGRLNLDRFRDQVRSVEGAAGRPALDPQLLVSLWVYSYSQGVTSARAIERLCEHDPGYQWLTGLESVSAHTLSSFRVDHPAELRDLFEKVLALLSVEGLITLERVMQDGTRVRACASSSGFRTKARIEEHLKAAHETVELLDRMGEEESSLRVQRARERAAREREQRLQSALRQFADLEATRSRVDRVSTTDPEARVMKQADGGSAPSYNVQISTDAAHSVIVGIDVTQAGNDYRQLIPAIDRLEEQGKRPRQMVVDGGYISSENIIAMAARGVDLVGPEPRNKADANRQKSYRHRGVHPDYEASRFQYDEASRTYVCPQGKRLKYDAKEEREGTVRLRYKASGQECAACPAKNLCCPRNRRGRSIERIEPVPAIATYRARVVTDEARAIYRTRSRVAEFPNLWLKAKHGLRQFRLRGKAKVVMESIWAALTYDIQQWIRLCWARDRVVLRTA
jgi:transposase